MELGISGRRALVTGASSGLGLATARALVAQGVHVVIAARSS
ncbi:MAG: SDR family NAD(P)-dependent oxidoreductase, partial [Actinobacteria bacterium]|nr:SDR family NAD(P)-dependent oxidoreductase [Actinomycetota bacterium]